MRIRHLFIPAILILLWNSYLVFQTTAFDNWHGIDLPATVQALTVLMIGVFLVIEKQNLVESNLDNIVFIMFIATSTVLQVASFDVYNAINIAVGLVVAYAYVKWVRKSDQNPPRPGWLILGLLFGLLLSAFFIPLAGVIEATGHHVRQIGLLTGLLLQLDEIASVALFEELIYRSILWGGLRKIGLGDKAIIPVQAIVFWLSHQNMLGNNLMFWFVLPIMGLALGFITYKFKSISPSIVAHGVFNTVVRYYVVG